MPYLVAKVCQKFYEPCSVGGSILMEKTWMVVVVVVMQISIHR